MCTVEQLLCNVGLDIFFTLFLIMICYDLMCTFYISSPILVIQLCVLLAAYASYSSSRITRFYIKTVETSLCYKLSFCYCLETLVASVFLRCIVTEIAIGCRPN